VRSDSGVVKTALRYVPPCRQLTVINTASAKHLTLAKCVLQGHARDGYHCLPHHGIICYYGQPPQETTKMFLFQSVQTSPHFQTHTSYLLKPNDIYICRTAALTSRRYILNIYSTNIHIEYFKHAA